MVLKIERDVDHTKVSAEGRSWGCNPLYCQSGISRTRVYKQKNAAQGEFDKQHT
jgi:hypothetical protein